MRVSEYTDDQIISAGNALIADNKRVTAFGIRNIIGGGNAKRIKQVWDEYIASKSVAAPEVLSELPVDVSEKLDEVILALNTQIVEMANQVNHVAVTTSERRVAEAVSEARERQESAEAELTEAAITVEQLESRVDEGQQEIQKLNELLSKANAQLREANDKCTALSQNLATVEKDLEVETAKSAELAQQLLQKTKENQGQAEKHQEAVASLKSEHKQIVTDLKAAHESAVRDLKAAHAEAVKGHQKAVSDLESQHQKEVSGLNKQLEDAATNLSDTKGQLEQVQGKYQEANDQILVMAAERDSAKDEAAKSREESILSAQKIKELNAEIERLAKKK